MKTEASCWERKLRSNQITTAYIEGFRLDESKKYKVMVINKNPCNNGFDKIEPDKEILNGKLISQHRFIFIFECISRKKLKKRVCINKLDYILNKKLIKEY